LKKIGSALVAILLILVLILTGCGGNGDGNANENAIGPATPVTLTLATFFGGPSMQVKTLQDMADEIEQATQGLVKIDIYPGGSLLAATELWDGVLSGVADMAYLCQYQPSGNHPFTEMNGLPLGAPTGWVMSKVAQDTYQEFLPRSSEEYDGAVLFWLTNVTPEVLMTVDPVYSIADLAGKQIKAVAAGADYMEALGAIPRGIPTPDTYDMIQKGDLDGALIATEALNSWKLAEVVNYVTNIWQIGKG